MAARSWIRSPARLAGLFVLVAGIPLAGLGWLGYRVLQQQADLDSERLQTQLDNSATLLARELDRALTTWESVAAAALESPSRPVSPPAPAGTAILIMNASGFVRALGIRLPYYPMPSVRPQDHRAALAPAEIAEFQRKDFAAAADLYTAIAAGPDRQLTAIALLGVSRTLDRLGRRREALTALDRLATLGNVTVVGAPAELVAHRQRLALFEASSDRAAVAREREWLTTALASGRLTIDRATYDEHTETLGLSPAPSQDALLLADVATDHWRDWQQAEGRGVTTVRDRSIVSVWRKRGSEFALVIGGAGELAAAMRPLSQELRVGAHVQDAEGRTVWGATDTGRPEATRELRGDIGLPWTLTVAADAPATSTSLSRQQLFGIGFGLLALVVVGASYTVFRFVSKELAVARLQSDFVAAVSHEFRTPVTALRHVSDLLEEGAAAPEDLPEFYKAIGKESRRLHGLIENLLDFGKLEEGRHVYEFNDLDVVSLTRDVVHDVTGRAVPNGHAVRLSAPDTPMPIRADRSAVVLALRNIVENAVKYSPDADAVDVRVCLRDDGRHVAIEVQDYGVGVPATEQRDVFRKFVRGSAAKSLMVKGTGIGLAMADRVVRDHGGSITVRSESGQGSTFIISLPRAYA